MLSISQLASYTGVTVRAVRHYHHVGLLPEPERDRSGYRRYDAVAVVRLVRIRTLAEVAAAVSGGIDVRAEADLGPLTDGVREATSAKFESDPVDGPGDDDGDDDNSGPGHGDHDGDDDNSGPGGGHGGDDDNSGPGGGHGGDDDNSGPGGGN